MKKAETNQRIKGYETQSYMFKIKINFDRVQYQMQMVDVIALNLMRMRYLCWQISAKRPYVYPLVIVSHAIMKIENASQTEASTFCFLNQLTSSM